MPPTSPTVDATPLHRGEIELVVVWTRSGFQLSGDEDRPWAQRVLAKLRALWKSAPPRPDDDTPRDYQVPRHQTRPIDTPRERAAADARANAGRTESDRESFRGHGIRPGDPLPGDVRACTEHVAEIAARYDAGRAVMLAAVRMREAVLSWGSLVHAHVIADGERVLALNDTDGSRTVLWDPDEDAERWWEPDRAAQGNAAEPSSASSGVNARETPRERKKAPPRIGQ